MPRRRGSSGSNLTALGNTKQGRENPCYRWCFVLNNYTENERTELLKWCSKCSKIYILGYEVGEECGTPHIQGYISLKKKMRFGELKKLNDRISWRKCNGTEEHNLTYCSKDGKFDTNAKIKREVRVITDLHPWQIEVEQLLMQPADDRTVYWIYNPEGCKGKTQFLKYLVKHYGVIFTSGGRKNDIMNLLFNNQPYLLSADPAIVVWNLPRDIDEHHISYEAIESTKDGLICNNKFECGSFIMNSPHVLILSNKLPLLHKLTKDRWKIFEINPSDLSMHPLIF